MAWIVCVIVTAAGGFPVGSKARTDGRIKVLQEANWFRFPYPGRDIITIRKKSNLCFLSIFYPVKGRISSNWKCLN